MEKALKHKGEKDPHNSVFQPNCETCQNSTIKLPIGIIWTYSKYSDQMWLNETKFGNSGPAQAQYQCFESAYQVYFRARSCFCTGFDLNWGSSRPPMQNLHRIWLPRPWSVQWLFGPKPSFTPEPACVPPLLSQVGPNWLLLTNYVTKKQGLH